MIDYNELFDQVKRSEVIYTTKVSNFEEKKRRFLLADTTWDLVKTAFLKKAIESEDPIVKSNGLRILQYFYLRYILAYYELTGHKTNKLQPEFLKIKRNIGEVKKSMLSVEMLKKMEKKFLKLSRKKVDILENEAKQDFSEIKQIFDKNGEFKHSLSKAYSIKGSLVIKVFLKGMTFNFEIVKNHTNKEKEILNFLLLHKQTFEKYNLPLTQIYNTLDKRAEIKDLWFKFVNDNEILIGSKESKVAKILFDETNFTLKSVCKEGDRIFRNFIFPDINFEFFRTQYYTPTKKTKKIIK